MKTKILILTALYSSILQANNDVTSSPAKSPLLTSRTVSLVNQNTNTTWVDQKVEEIKPQRHGLNISMLATLKNPFIVIKEKPKEGAKSLKAPTSDKLKTDKNDLTPTKRDMSKEPLTLQIVLNSSALVNGKWLKENDTFRGYKLTQIHSEYIVFERKTKKIKLFIAQKSDNINISTK